MNLFERWNNRFGRNGSSTVQARSEKDPQAVDQPPPLDQFEENSKANAYAAVYEFSCPEEWATPEQQSTRQPSAIPSNNCSGKIYEAVQDAHDVSKTKTMQTIPKAKVNSTATNQSKRVRNPLGSFYNVSSDDDDGSDGDEGNDDESDPTPAAFERRSMRLRRSLNKAQAALPADFADRICVSPEMSDSMYRDPSGTRLPKNTSCVTENAGDILAEPHDLTSEDEDAAHQMANSVPSLKTRPSNSHLDSGGTVEDAILGQEESSSSPTVSSKESGSSTYSYGVQWYTERFSPLEELMTELRDKPSGSTYLMKTISQRSGCRCALCGHDSLLLFPVLNASLASGYWGGWSVSGKSHGRGPSYPAPNIDVHTRLVLFRQCRGWYEVLNESQQPIPHLTTVEQMRRAKPSTFLVRRDLRCLIAPPNLLIPHFKESRPSGDGPPPPPFPPSVIATATAPETLMAASPETIPAGTLMHYVTYLPHCSLRRGRKIKELGLILATRRALGSPIRRSKFLDSVEDDLPSRAYYIGLEDSTPAVFPARFALSPVAGPENISGVHSLASIFRKFRLPLSVKPVCMTEQTSDSSTNSSRIQQPNQTNSLASCGLSALPGVSFDEQKFLRLESVYRNDVLIISPTSKPERLFLITPSMLPDHLFQLGTSTDPAYVRLFENHRVQATNFLAVAHPKDSLNYLVRHMRDVTREPRDSYTARELIRNKRNTSSANSAPEVQMSQEEIYKAYDELDDIYFYIRHGYYPSKHKRSEEALKSDVQQSSNRSSADYVGIPYRPGETAEASQVKKMSTENSSTQPRTGMPTAEELLAASLSSPFRNQNSNVKYPNGRVGSTYRIQPKEYGI